MFNPDFYPTPKEVAEKMTFGHDLTNKIVLEPSAGKGDLIDHILGEGAKEVLSCEINHDLQQIIKNKSTFLMDDFLSVKAEQISHINAIVMNPPFSKDVQHILHAFEVAPSGCDIMALCNLQTVKNTFSQQRQELKVLIKNFGSFQDLGECFTNSERRTSVEIALIRLKKPANDYQTEFNGFFMEEEERAENGAGLMPYNVIRDLVERYIESVKLFDEQLNIAVKINELGKGFFNSNIALSITDNEKPTTRENFKKDLQRNAWTFIFNKMNLYKITTKQLREDLNKFVEEQQNTPFTMRNIYRMLEIVIATTGQRMDKAILEAFDNITKHYHENRFNVEGWKTNSHYLVNEKFIFPWMVEVGFSGQVSYNYSGNFERIEDLVKALCFLMGEDYNKKTPLRNFISDRENQMNWGKWHEWDFFEIRPYKKGTLHFRFKDHKVWERFNSKVAELKGYPLHWSEPNTKKTEQPKQRATTEAKTIFEFNIY